MYSCTARCTYCTAVLQDVHIVPTIGEHEGDRIAHVVAVEVSMVVLSEIGSHHPPDLRRCVWALVGWHALQPQVVACTGAAWPRLKQDQGWTKLSF